MKPQPVEVWTGQLWRYGEWLRTVERGRKRGWYVVRLQKLVKGESGSWEWTWAERIVPADSVRPA